jgi:hypothetical protein
MLQMTEDSDYEQYFKGLNLRLNPCESHLVYIPDIYERVPPGSHIAAPSVEKSDPWNHAIYIGGHRVIQGDSTRMRETHANDFVNNTNAVSIIEYDEDGQWPRAATIRAISFMKTMPYRPQKEFANVPVLCRVGLARYDTACKRVDVLLKQNEVRLPDKKRPDSSQHSRQDGHSVERTCMFHSCQTCEEQLQPAHFASK